MYHVHGEETQHGNAISNPISTHPEKTSNLINTLETLGKLSGDTDNLILKIT